MTILYSFEGLQQQNGYSSILNSDSTQTPVLALNPKARILVIIVPTLPSAEMLIVDSRMRKRSSVHLPVIPLNARARSVV